MFQEKKTHYVHITLDLTVLRADGKKMGCALFFALDSTVNDIHKSFSLHCFAQPPSLINYSSQLNVTVIQYQS